MKRQKIDSLEFKKMGFYYDPAEKVFSDFSYQFEEGEILYLQGPRGSGKNTLIKMLLGLLSPNEGEYLINGVNVNDFSYSDFDPFRLAMGHSFDNGGLINNLTLYENFLLILDYHNCLEPAKRYGHILTLLERFHLDTQKHIRPAFLSGSAKKAAAVLRSFILQPEVLILDNPTQGLSMEHIPILVELIKEHQKEHHLKYVFISSNDNELINLLNGKIVQVTDKGLIEYKALRRVS